MEASLYAESGDSSNLYIANAPFIENGKVGNSPSNTSNYVP